MRTRPKLWSLGLPLALGALLALPASSQATKDYVAFVANSKDGTVSVINLTTLAVTATYDVGRSPRGVAADDGLGIVAVMRSNEVVAVDADLGTVLEGAVGKKPVDVALANNGAVVSLFGQAQVQLVDETGVRASAPVEKRPTGIAADPKGNFVAVVCSGTSTVDSLQPADLPFARRQSIPVGTKPAAVAVARNGDAILVTSPKDGTLSIIDPGTGAVIETLDVGGGPWGVASSPVNNNVAAVALSKADQLLLREHKKLARIDVGRSPREVAFSPDGKLVLVTNYRGDSVSVVDVASHTVIATIPVGRKPWGVGVTAKR